MRGMSLTQSAFPAVAADRRARARALTQWYNTSLGALGISARAAGDVTGAWTKGASLKTHNNKRKKHVNTPPLGWSWQAANVAKNWAKKQVAKCTGNSASCGTRTPCGAPAPTHAHAHAHAHAQARAHCLRRLMPTSLRRPPPFPRSCARANKSQTGTGSFTTRIDRAAWGRTSTRAWDTCPI